MTFKLKALPLTKSQYGFDNTLAFSAEDMRAYAMLNVKPLLEEIKELQEIKLLYERMRAR